LVVTEDISIETEPPRLPVGPLGMTLNVHWKAPLASSATVARTVARSPARPPQYIAILPWPNCAGPYPTRGANRPALMLLE
jgi:hypothetical protein